MSAVAFYRSDRPTAGGRYGNCLQQSLSLLGNCAGELFATLRTHIHDIKRGLIALDAFHIAFGTGNHHRSTPPILRAVRIMWPLILRESTVADPSDGSLLRT